MSNFIFNAAAAALAVATLDLGTGNYYAHLVTTTPLPTDSTVANLVVPTVSGYAPSVLTGLSDNSQRWTFDSFAFPKYTFVATPPVGVVICKRAGASPAASDQVICYSDFLNSVGQVILTPVGAYLISLSFGANGAINKAYRYQYSSGAYVAGADGGYPKGLIYLIGTKNNTTAFVNPSGTSSLKFIDSSSSIVTAMSDRAANFQVGLTSYFGLSLQNNRIRFGQIGFLVAAGNTVASYNVFASNNLPGDLAGSEVASPSNWTSLGSITLTANQWNLFTPSDTSTYWKYLRVATPVVGGNIGFCVEMEFYNSSILSPTQNIV